MYVDMVYCIALSYLRAPQEYGMDCPGSTETAKGQPYNTMASCGCLDEGRFSLIGCYSVA